MRPVSKTGVYPVCAGTPRPLPIATYFSGAVPSRHPPRRLSASPFAKGTAPSLLIADDVGAGKTVEAGLILRELLLRRRVDFALVSAPAGLVRQWQDKLEAKFGLTFTIIDREYLNVLRRERGYGAGPWAAGS
jgi:SNF2 family DNA or RNA helicase